MIVAALALDWLDEDGSNVILPFHKVLFHLLDRDVLAAEAVDETLCLRDAQLLADVPLHERRRGRRERDDGCRAQLGDAFAELAIVRTKIVTPL